MKIKNYLIWVFALLIAIQVLNGGSIASAMGYKLVKEDVTIDITPTSIQVDKAGDTADVQVAIHNAKNAPDMIGVTILDNDGNLLKTIPAIPADSAAIVNLKCVIANPGTNIGFTVKWMANSLPYEKTISVPTKLKVLEKKLTFTRTVDKQSVDAGQEVTLTYTVKNTGSAEVADIKVSDGALATFPIFTLAPGQENVLTKRLKIVKDTISKPKLEALGILKELAAMTIKVSQPKMGIDLTADKDTVKPGESVILTCFLKNSGNVDFKNIIVTDDELGNVKTVPELLAGKSVTFTKKVSIDGAKTFLFHVTAHDAANKEITVDSAPLEIATSDGTPQQSTQLSIKATVDVSQLASPGKVKFDIVVTNHGASALTKLEITELTLGSIGKMDQLESGDKLFEKSVDIAKAGTYTFKVIANDSKGNVIEAMSAAIDIKMGGTPTPSSIADTPAPTASSGQGGKVSTLFAILGVIVFLIVAAGITLVILVIQERRNQPGKHEKKRL